MPDQGIDALNLLNAGYVADIYEQYRRDPASVDPDWRSLFDSGTSGFEPVSAPPAQPTNGNQADAPAAPTHAGRAARTDHIGPGRGHADQGPGRAAGPEHDGQPRRADRDELPRRGRRDARGASQVS